MDRLHTGCCFSTQNGKGAGQTLTRGTVGVTLLSCLYCQYMRWGAAVPAGYALSDILGARESSLVQFVSFELSIECAFADAELRCDGTPIAIAVTQQTRDVSRFHLGQRAGWMVLMVRYESG